MRENWRPATRSNGHLAMHQPPSQMTWQQRGSATTDKQTTRNVRPDEARQANINTRIGVLALAQGELDQCTLSFRGSGNHKLPGRVRTIKCVAGRTTKGEHNGKTSQEAA